MTIIDADVAKLAGLQIDLLQKIRQGHLTLDQLLWFVGLNKHKLDVLIGTGSADFAVPSLSASPPPEPVLDFIIRVDRSVKPNYPEWMKKLKHPELECLGPVEYDLQDGVEQWLHDDQKNGVVVGNTIHKHLQKDDALAPPA